jgi:O-Antigen ligase
VPVTQGSQVFSGGSTARASAARAVRRVAAQGDRGATGFLLYMAIAAVPVGFFFSIPIFRTADKTVPLTLSEIALVPLALTYCWRFLGRSRVFAGGFVGGKWVLAFAAWALITLAVATGRFDLGPWRAAVAGMYLARWVAYALLYFAVYEVTVDRHIAKRITGRLFMGGLAFAIFGLVQAAFFPGDFALWLHSGARPYIDYDPQGHRLVSTFLDPNQAAGFILIFALVALSFCVHGFRRWTKVFVVLAAALLATLSRGGVFGFLVGVLLLLRSARSSRWRVVKMGVLTLALSLAVYPLLATEISQRLRLGLSTGDSLANRVSGWQADLRAIARYPVSGLGFDTLGYVGPRYDVGTGEGNAAFGISGDLLLVTLLTGVVGLALYLGMLRSMLGALTGLGNTASDGWARAFGRGVCAASLASVAAGFFTTTLLYPPTMAALWVLWALGRRLASDAALRRSMGGPALYGAAAP